jgi:hypothetical protein
MATTLATGIASAATAHEVRVFANSENLGAERLGADGSTVLGGAQRRVIGHGEGFAVEAIGTPNAQGAAISRLSGQGKNTSIEFVAPRGSAGLGQPPHPAPSISSRSNSSLSHSSSASVSAASARASAALSAAKRAASRA